MKIKVLNRDDKALKLSFLISGTDNAFVNTLRRAIIDETPTLAIEDVEFRRNSSVMYDEVIAHRLGLIPLKTDLQSYTFPAECKCKGALCASCHVKFTLKSLGPKEVYASEMKSEDPKIVPVYPEMPIVKLIKGQKIELEATAVLGTGKEHVKWSPGHAYFKHKPEIEITKNVQNPEDIAKRCPKKVFEIKDNKLSVNQQQLLECDLCEKCEELSNKAITVKECPDEFVFYLESFGQLRTKEIIDAALDVLKERLETFEKTIASAKK